MNFSKFLSPINKANFFSEFYQKKHLFISRNNQEYYSGVFNLKDVDYYLSKSDNYYPSIRMAQDGKELMYEKYVTKDTFGEKGLIQNDKVYESFYSGATIVLQAHQRNLKSLKRLCLKLKEETSFNFSANAYLTPKHSKGFTFHYDTHDVFIMQIQGSKKFHLYDKPIYLPTNKQGHNSNPAFKSKNYNEEKPIFSETLLPGDLLYIPRGLVHKAETLDDMSLHCTLGAFPKKWHSFFEFIATEAFKFDYFREAIPTYNKLSNEEQVLVLKNKIEQLFNEDKIVDLVKDYRDKNEITERISMSEGRLLDYEKFDDISLKTVVQLRESIKSKIYLNDENIQIKFYDKTISFPRFMNDAVNFIFSKGTFAISDIQNGIDDESKLIFIKKLIQEGLLKVQTNNQKNTCQNACH